MLGRRLIPIGYAQQGIVRPLSLVNNQWAGVACGDGLGG
jgi:hypothetical protein